MPSQVPPPSIFSHAFNQVATGKLLDCVDGDITVSATPTSASLHDSQAAIFLAQMSSERVTNLYELMDIDAIARFDDVLGPLHLKNFLMALRMEPVFAFAGERC